MVGDAVDLAAKALCPMDHTPPPNLLDDPSLYVRIPEPRLTDDELAAVRSIIADCNSKAIAEPSRAVGMQRAAGPGEVSSETRPTAIWPGVEQPSPGITSDLSDSELLYAAAGALQLLTERHERVPALINVLRDRAAQFLAIESGPDLSVGHEDLAAHITESRRVSEEDGWGGTAIDDHIASDLLADYLITPK